MFRALLLALCCVSCCHGAALTVDTVDIPGGGFMLGTDKTHNQNADAEGPARRVEVKPFELDATPVTNAQFRVFVRDTKYKTEAQDYGWSFVLSSLASAEVKANKEVQSLPDAKQWLAVPGAWWRQPEGPDSGIKGREDHPVTHISLKDAMHYCKWAGKRLPQEMEWERAARGGVDGHEYPWGNEAMPGQQHMMNIWGKGKFPEENHKEDGWHGTAPVRAFPANAYGVYSVVGNVWEWTTTIHTPGKKDHKGSEEAPKFVLRGGSFVDSVDGSFNHKARVTTRMGNTPDSGSHNTGFRCAKDGPQGAQHRDPPIQPTGPPRRPKRGGGGMPPGVDQAMLQKIVAEKGVEGLQQFMKESGMGGSVMTPQQLKEKQVEIKQKKAELEKKMGKEL